MSLKYESEEERTTEQEENTAHPPTTFPLYTIILIGAYVVVFLVQIGTGLERSIELVGFDKAGFRHGDYWRLLTGAALHGGILHILFNSYAFYSFGRIVEMLTARAHLAIVFLAAAIGGGALSYVLSPSGISVGASGGIVGLIGYLAVYAFRRKDFITAQFRQSLLINIGFILVYGIAMWQTIDNFAHIGGLITGAVYAFATVSTDPYRDPREVSPVVQIAGLASMGIYLAACGFSILLMLNVV